MYTDNQKEDEQWFPLGSHKSDKQDLRSIAVDVDTRKHFQPHPHVIKSTGIVELDEDNIDISNWKDKVHRCDIERQAMELY